MANVPTDGRQRVDDRKGVYYAEYLKLDSLLNGVQPESGRDGKKPAHEEHLFIVIHQVYELWFKQILHELSSVIDIFADKTVDSRVMLVVVNRLQRVVEIQRILNAQIKVLETMDSMDFMEFRNYLNPASGFQSVQFRLLENRLGLLMENRSPYQQLAYKGYFSPADAVRLEESERQITLFSVIEKWLERTPTLETGNYKFWEAFSTAVKKMLSDRRVEVKNDKSINETERAALMQACDVNESMFDIVLNEASYNKLREDGQKRLSFKAFQGAVMIHLYRHEPLFHLPYQILTLLTELDGNMTQWRHQHLQMVQRMIGGKVGTGGSSGYQYLRTTITDKYKVFLDLFHLPTYLLSRAYVPPVPEAISKMMDFTI